jgi:hypothetical protein
VDFFLAKMEIRIIQSQYAGGILLPPVSKLVATFIFAIGQKCKRISALRHSNPPTRVDFYLAGVNLMYICHHLQII